MREIWEYRDLVSFLILRELKTRYAQSVLGFAWAVLHPAVYMVVFTVIFGMLTRIESDGKPYAIFSYAAIIPWTFFAGAVGISTSSLSANQTLLTKVYFPRLILPMATPLARMPDFFISLSLMVGLMIWYGQAPTIGILALPLLLLLALATAIGLGLCLSALSIQYRDIRYALPMAIQLGMYVSPIIYPVSLIPERFLLIYSLNSMVGVIEGFRAAFLGTRPMPLDRLAVGSITAFLTLAIGAFVFNRAERKIADVI